jgi:hypothetical protein
MALLGWENAIEASSTSLAVSAAADGASAELLRVPIGAASVAWQTPAGTTTASLTVTAAAAVAFRAACLSRTNLTTGATIRVRVGSAANIISAPAYDSGTVSAGVAVGIGQALHVMSAAVSAVAMRIDISDAANPDGYLNIPLAYAGPGTEFNIAYSSNTGLDVRRGDTTTRGGQVFVDALSRARGWTLDVGHIRDAAADWLDPLEASAAQGRNILFVPRVGNARAAAESVFGILAPGRRGFLGVNGRSWSATISERL